MLSDEECLHVPQEGTTRAGSEFDQKIGVALFRFNASATRGRARKFPPLHLKALADPLYFAAIPGNA